MSNFMQTHGWPIMIWGTIEKAGKQDFSGRVSYWAIIGRTYHKHDGSMGSQRIFVTGTERSGLDKAEPGKVIFCSAVYQEGKDKQGTWKPRPWVTSSTVMAADAALPGPPPGFPPVPSHHHQNGHSVMHYQQPPYSTPAPAHMPPASIPASGQQPGIYHDHEMQF